MKWCSGPCERLLPREAFYANGPGRIGARCRGCQRVFNRGWARKRYRNDRAWRSKERARVAEWYAANRARKCAAERARYWRKKVAA
jgi:hypothetical protein